MSSALLSSVPIALTIVLLVTRLPAWVPPAMGIVAATGVSLFVLDGATGDLLHSAVGSWVTLVKVLAIIGSGALLARVMHHTGAQTRLADWLSSGGTSVAAALLMSHGVVPFLESITGFGVTIIIGLPLMLAFGFSPMPAATMVLLGLTVSPWGSMGPGTLLATEIAGANLRDMGLASGILSLPAFLVSGAVVAIIAGRAANSRGTVRHRPVLLHTRWLAMGIGSGLLHGGSILAANWMIGTPVAGALGSAFMTVLWLLVIRRGRLLPGPGSALLPYSVLMVGTIGGQLAGTHINVVPLAEVIESPALWALLGAVSGLSMFALTTATRPALFVEAGSMLLQVGIPTTLYILFGTIMDSGGLAQALASGLTGMGLAYLFVSPFLAALSGYITASGTGANAMLGTTQIAAANALDVSPFWMMASQNVASGWAIAASPARIELAYRMSMLGHSRDGDNQGDEGPAPSRVGLLKIMLPVILLTTAAWGVLNLLLFG